MSGFEVISLLLAVFPVIVSSLEHWRESAEVMENWTKIKPKYKKCRREMRIQEEFFRQNIEQYLLPLVADEEELNLLISEPCGPAWKDPALETRLRERLPKAYDLYFETIEELGEVMKTLNNQLRDLLVSHERSTAIMTNSRGNNSSGLSKGLLEFWQHANRIFKLLNRAWCCSCQFSHGANLALTHRRSPEVDFKVLFWFSESDHVLGPWTWQETRIKRLEASTPAATTAAKPPQAMNHQKSALRQSSVSKTYNLDRPTARTAKGVGGVRSTPSGTSKPEKAKVSWATESIPKAEPEVMPSVEPKEITNLCSAIATHSSEQSCLGCLVDNEHRYSVLPLLKQQNSLDQREFVSLDTILGDASGVRLTRRVRYLTALTLASSYLQLHSTPWLGAQLSKQDILFLRESSGCDGIITGDPYVSCQFQYYPKNDQSNEKFDNRPFLNLGIMLLELCFGIAIENNETRRKLGSSDPAISVYLDLAAALEWNESVLEEAGPKYAAAVKWCLERVGQASRDSSWRNQLLHDVVEPLQSCSESLEGSMSV